MGELSCGYVGRNKWGFVWDSAGNDAKLKLRVPRLIAVMLGAWNLHDFHFGRVVYSLLYVWHLWPRSWILGFVWQELLPVSQPLTAKSIRPEFTEGSTSNRSLPTKIWKFNLISIQFNLYKQLPHRKQQLWCRNVTLCLHVCCRCCLKRDLTVNDWWA